MTTNTQPQVTLKIIDHPARLDLLKARAQAAQDAWRAAEVAHDQVIAAHPLIFDRKLSAAAIEARQASGRRRDLARAAAFEAWQDYFRAAR